MVVGMGLGGVKTVQSETIDRFGMEFVKRRKQSWRAIGLENEFPWVKNGGEAVDSVEWLALFTFLCKNGFQAKCDDDTKAPLAALGHVAVGAKRDLIRVSISPDAGVSTLEIGVGPCANLHIAAEAISKTFETLKRFFAGRDSTLLGYGIQPVSKASRSRMTQSSRCLLPLSPGSRFATNQYVKASDGFDFHLQTLTAASQCSSKPLRGSVPLI
jgi:hypothetical protein